MTAYCFKHPISDEDYEQLYDVMRKSFPDEDVDAIVRRFKEYHPGMIDSDYFMVKQEDEAVAGLVLIPQTWSIDGVEFNVAEMGCVGTVPEHRRNGTQWILNEAFDEYARSKGYDLCVLAGIPYFYRQFGYQYAVELDYNTEIDTDRLPTNSKTTAREFMDSDIEKAQKLLEELQSSYLVHSNRTPTVWKIQQETRNYGAEPFKATTVLDGDEMVGYHRWSKDEASITIKELCVKEAYVDGIAACIREQAERLGVETVKTKLSHINPFSKYLIERGATVNKPYGWQIKLLDPRDFLMKLGPALEKRLEESKFRGLTKELRMNFWKYALNLIFEDGKLMSVDTVTEAGRDLGMNPYASIQLFFGFRSREDLEYAYPDFYIRGGNEELIDVLFPRRPGYIHYMY